MGKMTVYHGSYLKIEKPEVIIGKYTKDFGPGFYCTLIMEQAERWAKRLPKSMLNIYDVRMKSDLKILEFKEMTEQWLDFIIDCRTGKSHDYDIVIGAMANDQVYNFIEDVLDGVITREQFWVMAKFKYPTHQINFCTKKALQCLSFRKVEEVKS